MEVTAWGALVGGLIVFFSPCVLPIVPFYLSYMAGVSMAEIRDDGGLQPGVRRRAFFASVFFSLGIITVFVLLGATVFGLSRLFSQYKTEFNYLAAALVALMGLHFLGVIRIPFLNRSFQVQAGDTQQMSVLGAYVVGFAFAAGWTPCVGGVLTGVIMTAQNEATAWEGLGLMLIFGAAMTAPFVVATRCSSARYLLFSDAGSAASMPWLEKRRWAAAAGFARCSDNETQMRLANWMIPG